MKIKFTGEKWCMQIRSARERAGERTSEQEECECANDWAAFILDSFKKFIYAQKQMNKIKNQKIIHENYE